MAIQYHLLFWLYQRPRWRIRTQCGLSEKNCTLSANHYGINNFSISEFTIPPSQCFHSPTPPGKDSYRYSRRCLERFFKIVNYAKMTKLSHYWKWTAFNSLLGEEFLRCGFWTLSFWFLRLLWVVCTSWVFWILWDDFVVRFDAVRFVLWAHWHTNYVFLEACSRGYKILV